MKSKFSKTWKSSVKPRKQRKYLANAPLHIKGRQLCVNLSKELRAKHKTRNVRVKKGDTVRILRGDFKGSEGKVNDVEIKKTRVYIDGVERSKKDGSKVRVPFKPSNLQIVSLDLSDAKRKEKLTNSEDK